ncbi:hypothetical protein [Roseomonas marmotae]|uniref:Uncharacterized protein n=1 Tax=Roseomonas marmotae TaxID=2768161 RepID=A0ABS3KHR9_9PROT|nr:hypothetical protein [Roseomonas marmotae]MBO1077002.1 hypothetical protein [Roseomonas marmotae]QTI79805.1 hypothetical protein IAI58_03115 [Roseomonas marmotae]
MTDTPPNRLWPLALMGWLAAFPPLSRDASAATPGGAQPEAQLAGTSLSVSRDARFTGAPLSASERAALRRRRRREGS